MLIFYYDEAEDVEIHAVKKWVKVELEKCAKQYFISDGEEYMEVDPTYTSN